MRHPTTHRFLIWAGPTLIVFFGGCIGLVATLAGSFSGIKTWAEKWWAATAPIVTAPFFVALTTFAIVVYLAALVWSGQTAPVIGAQTASVSTLGPSSVSEGDSAESRIDPAIPDLPVMQLIKRLMEARNIEDDGSWEGLEKIRSVGTEIGDQMSLRKLSTWGRRFGGPLEPLPFEISKKGFGVGRNSTGAIYCALGYKDEQRRQIWIDDLRFLDAEIKEAWPNV